MGGITMITKDYMYIVDGNYNYPRYAKLTVWNKDFSDIYTNDFVLCADRVHSKYYKHIKHLLSGYNNEYIIDGEMYRLIDNKIERVTGGKQLALIQRKKTKEKTLAVGRQAISQWVHDFVDGGSMHRTGEKRNRNILSKLRRVDMGDYYYQNIAKSNGGVGYSWFAGEIQDYNATYGMDKSKVRELVSNYILYIDKDYNIVYKRPINGLQGDPRESNKVLLDMFGKRNDKPIFEVVEIDIPSIKELKVC